MNPIISVDETHIQLIRRSGLFDEGWYLRTYRDVAMLEMDPVEHYLRLGAFLERDPSPKFSTRDYLFINDDVAFAGINPLLHYVTVGQREGRFISLEEDIVTAERIAGRIPLKPGAPNVLLCAHDAQQQLFGGERSFLDMAAALYAIGVNVIVTLPQKNNVAYIDHLASLCSEIRILKYPMWRGQVPCMEKVVAAFELLIRELGIDIVYVNTIMLVEPQVAARRAGVASFCHVRELIEDDEHLMARIRMSAQEIAAAVRARSTHIIANSRLTASMFAGNDVIYAPNVVDSSIFDIPNTIGERIVFGMISSNLPKKGIHDLIEIARLCEVCVPQACFVAVGPLNDYVEAFIEAGLPQNLRFTGYAATPREAVAQMNVVLSLSHFSESFGRTVAEGLAARRPVIAYARGAVPELLQNGESGYLIEPGAVEDVVRKIEYLVANPERINAMGQAGRDFVTANFAPSALENALETAVRSVITKTLE
ncbi:glycosyltransferase family 4 protein [Allorhizobium undicola]|uniref:glycosyltransferase family 4 protein n=1 Tax=Allorhizobium undicola TaxID=78527 RepID=UPI003D3478E1